jgi:hypothetical protein
MLLTALVSSSYFPISKRKKMIEVTHVHPKLKTDASDKKICRGEYT